MHYSSEILAENEFQDIEQIAHTETEELLYNIL